jgi:glycosyltransferase involved in cell wall biosynthesis
MEPRDDLITDNPPLVGAVIPAFNRPHYLKLALQSVLKQTYPNFEVIVSDDCSSHDLHVVANSLADRRICRRPERR